MISMLIGASVGMAVSLFGTRWLIGFLRRAGIGQHIHADTPAGHIDKAGTPTMGGIAIVAGAVTGYLVSHIRGGAVFTRTGLVVVACVVGAAVVGLIDDAISVRNERNLGLTKTAKTLGLLAVGTGFSIAALTWAFVDSGIGFTRLPTAGIDVPDVVWVPWAVLVLYATTNAVNFTDGLDGLAAGSAVYAFLALVVFGFWAFRHPEVYGIAHGLDLAVVAASLAGATVGFLWWNAKPAQIFMGDTGSLAIGAGIASLHLVTHTELLLPLAGGLFVIEALSVVIQVAWFRLTGGRRVFRMAPIHHHFELAGWEETTVIVRFWIIAGISAALAVGLYYADFLTTGALD